MSEAKKYIPLTKETWNKFIKDQLNVILQNPQPVLKFYSKQQVDIFEKAVQETIEYEKIRIGSKIITK